MRMIARIVLLVAALGYAGWLISLNQQDINISLVFAERVVPAWLVLLGSLLLGSLAAGLACSWPILRYRLRLRRSRQRIAELEQEIHGLRTLPLAGEDSEGAKALEA